jgi:hypothetical protein
MQAIVSITWLIKHTETLLRKNDYCTYLLLLSTNKEFLYLFIVTTQQDAFTHNKKKKM